MTNEGHISKVTGVVVNDNGAVLNVILVENYTSLVIFKKQKVVAYLNEEEEVSNTV